NQVLIIAFATAAGSALGAAAAWFASVSGGKHRDESTSYNTIGNYSPPCQISAVLNQCGYGTW
ncbi:MAG: hypothetical protein V7695_25075, partial [Sulfitobacter sp.]